MKTCLFVAALLLAGCGGGSGGGDAFGGGGTAPVTAPTPPVTAGNAVFSGVQTVLGKDADGEPVAVEDLALAESQEPQPVN